MRSHVARHYQHLATYAAGRSVMRHKIGCVLVDKRQCEHVVAWNRWLGDPDGRGWSLHAEVWAVLRAEEYGMAPTHAFIARHIGRLARPCPRCMGVLARAGVEEIHYTMAPGVWGVV